MFARRSHVTHKLSPPQASLNSPNVNHIDKLFGLFSESHMQYHLFNDKTYEPTLMDMTRKALQVMKKNPNGYVLLVESARIDHAHHENRANLALAETVHFHEVVEFVRSQVDESETLIVVTADHSHTMSISGYPKSRRPTVFPELFSLSIVVRQEGTTFCLTATFHAKTTCCTLL